MSGRSEAQREHDRRYPKTADVAAGAEPGPKPADPGRRSSLDSSEEVGEMRRPKGDPQRYDKHGGKLDHDGKPAKSET
jgi:hypothetical protein